MKGELVKVYDWHDEVLPYICEKMGIEVENFRDYHNVDPEAGRYCDFWHLCLDLFWVNEGIQNGGIFKMWPEAGMSDNEDLYDYLIKEDNRYSDHYGEWCKKLMPACDALYEEYGECILVRYEW